MLRSLSIYITNTINYYMSENNTIPIKKNEKEIEEKNKLKKLLNTRKLFTELFVILIFLRILSFI